MEIGTAISFGLARSWRSSRGRQICSRPVASVANVIAAMSAPLLLRISDSGCATSPRVSLSSMAAITLSQRKELDGPLLGVALAAALAAAGLALSIAGPPYTPQGAPIERDVQSTSWSSLGLHFPVC